MKDIIPLEQLEDEIMNFIRNPKLIKRAINAMKNAHKRAVKMKNLNLNLCVKRGYLKETEKKKYSQSYLAEYLNFAVNGKKDKKRIFVTNHKEILKRKEELLGKFKIDVLNPEEMTEMLCKEDMPSYIG